MASDEKSYSRWFWPQVEWEQYKKSLGKLLSEAVLEKGYKIQEKNKKKNGDSEWKKKGGER